jgi:hypothetical protein
MEEAMPFPRLSDVNVAQDTFVTISREQRISADSHMTEPPDLWEKRLPAALRDRAPRIPSRNSSNGHERAGGWDPYERLKDLAYDGIGAEVLYPSRGYAAYIVGDTELEEACCRAYNDWMIEFCSVARSALGLAMISLWNIEHAVQELERCRKAGLRGCHRAGASGGVALRLGPLRALLGRLPRPGDVGQHAHQFGPRPEDILTAAAQWAHARWRGRS